MDCRKLVALRHGEVRTLVVKAHKHTLTWKEPFAKRGQKYWDLLSHTFL